MVYSTATVRERPTLATPWRWRYGFRLHCKSLISVQSEECKVQSTKLEQRQIRLFDTLHFVLRGGFAALSVCPVHIRIIVLFMASFSLTRTSISAETSVSVASIDANGFRIHRVQSEFQSAETLLQVLLPDRLASDTKLKVLYLMPVEANLEHRYGDGLLEAKKLDLANKYQLICVAPTFSHLPWYADHPTDKTIRQESYLLKVVVPTIEKLYPAITERDGRLLVGFSKSGYGAWSLLLRHPNQFAKAAAWDAPLMKTAPDQFGMGPIYGTPENFSAYRLDRLLRDRAGELRPTTDQQSIARLIHLGYGNFRDHHERMESLLNELQIPHAYADGPKLEHTWYSGWLEEAVKRLVEGS